MDAVRTEMHAWFQDFGLDGILGPADQVHLSVRLLEQPHTEDKLAGILLLQERLLPGGHVTWSESSGHFVRLLDRGFLADWNSVDWFCVKVLADLLDREDQDTALALLEWSSASVHWRARASLVPFASRVGKPETYFEGFEEHFLAACTRLIRREERFAKTAVGWVLRNYATARPDKAETFIRQEREHFTSETMKVAQW